MKKNLLKEIIKKKDKKIEFSVITNLDNGESCIFEKNKILNSNFEKFKKEIYLNVNKKKNGVIAGTNIFVDTYVRPIKIVIVGAVHIAQYLVNFAKNLNFEIIIIDPRGYFASEQRFPNIKIINKWPKDAFAEIETDFNTALVALTHDPKIDDPGLHAALSSDAFYVACLGSRRTHAARCLRLQGTGICADEMNRLHGPAGLNIGALTPAEIAVSILAEMIAAERMLGEMSG